MSDTLDMYGPASLGKTLTPQQLQNRKSAASMREMTPPRIPTYPGGYKEQELEQSKKADNAITATIEARKKAQARKNAPMYGGAGAMSPTTIKKETFSNVQGTLQGGKEVNIVRRGQQATLNGKPVIADGAGNWVDATNTSVPMRDRQEVGKYEEGNIDRSAPQISEPASQPADPAAVLPDKTTPPPVVDPDPTDLATTEVETTLSDRNATPPNGDPLNTGQTGTQMSVPMGKPIANMTYDSFMSDIGTKMGLNVQNPFLSEDLPGTPGQTEKLALKNFQVGVSNMGGTADTREVQMVDGRRVPKVTINAAAGGALSSKLEGERQLVPGSEQTAETMEPDASTVFKDRSSRAFLDGGPGSMKALRRSEAARGIIYQGGQHFARDPEAEGGLRKISREAAGAVRFGSSMQEAIANNPIAAAKSKAQSRLSEVDMGGAGVFERTIPSVSQGPIVKGTDNLYEVEDNELTLHSKAQEPFGTFSTPPSKAGMLPTSGGKLAPDLSSLYNAAGLKGGGVTEDIVTEMRKKSIRPI